MLLQLRKKEVEKLFSLNFLKKKKKTTLVIVSDNKQNAFKSQLK